MEEVGGEGMGKVEAKGLVGPMAGEGGVVGGAKVIVGWEGLFPGGIGGGEEALNGGGACCVLVGCVGSRVGKMGGLPVGGGGAGVVRGGAIKEAVGEVAQAIKGVDSEEE